MPDATAPTIAGYTIEARIGQGGSSSVWRATGPQGTVVVTWLRKVTPWRQSRSRFGVAMSEPWKPASFQPWSSATM